MYHGLSVKLNTVSPLHILNGLQYEINRQTIAEHMGKGFLGISVQVVWPPASGQPESVVE